MILHGKAAHLRVWRATCGCGLSEKAAPGRADLEMSQAIISSGRNYLRTLEYFRDGIEATPCLSRASDGWWLTQRPPTRQATAILRVW